jgi:hypothetical protein
MAVHLLNQGNFPTCVNHAFTVSLHQGVVNKYGVALNPDALLVIAEHCYPTVKLGGGTLVDQCKEWAAFMKKAPPAFVGGESRRYCVTVSNIRVIDTWQAAYKEAQRTEGVLLPLVGISLEQGSHAIAVDKALRAPGYMRGLNSWGREQPKLQVTPENFECAVAFEPEIFRVTDERNASVKIPPVTQAYTDMCNVCGCVSCMHGRASARVCVCVLPCVRASVGAKSSSSPWSLMVLVYVPRATDSP